MNTSVHADNTDASSRLYEAAHREGTTTATVSTADLRQLLAAASQNNSSPQLSTLYIGTSGRGKGLFSDELLRQQHLHIDQALVECIAAAGIIREGVGLTGPELLKFSHALKSHLDGVAQAQDAYNAVISYMLANPCESPMEFLRCWNEGNFDSLRNEWPDAPEEIYLADSQHPDFKGLETAEQDLPSQLVGTKLLARCNEWIAVASSQGSDPKTVALLDEVSGFLAQQPVSARAADAADGVRDDLNPDGAYIQYEAAAKALSTAVQRAYPVTSQAEFKVGRHIIRGEVTAHRRFAGSTPGEFFIRNLLTGTKRKVTHRQAIATKGNQ